MKTRFGVFILLAVSLLSILVAGQALAAGTWDNYNLTVPRLGGTSVTYNRVKVSAPDKAIVCSQAVGAGYTLQARIEKVDNTVVADYKNITSLTRAEFTLNPSQAGVEYHARLRNPQIVAVQAIGWWSPDNPGPCGF